MEFEIQSWSLDSRLVMDQILLSAWLDWPCAKYVQGNAKLLVRFSWSWLSHWVVVHYAVTLEQLPFVNVNVSTWPLNCPCSIWMPLGMFGCRAIAFIVLSAVCHVESLLARGKSKFLTIFSDLYIDQLESRGSYRYIYLCACAIIYSIYLAKSQQILAWNRATDITKKHQIK